MINLLKNTFQEYGIQASDKVITSLSEFFNILVEFNTHTNLTRITTPQDAALKHFADSLMGAKFIPDGANVCDIGSGGGFPSIPLATYLPNCTFTLVDSTGKKVVFLNSAIDSLALKNARAVHGRAEEMGQSPKYREKFDIVTARAVASLPTLLEYCLPFVKVGGAFLAYKTESDELSISQNALKTLGGEISEVFSYTLGDLGDKRNVFVVKKVAHTPPKYPRGQGKPRSKPL